MTQQHTPTAAIPFSLSLPNLLERLEGLLIFAAAIAVYIHTQGSGVAFIALLFVPDVFMLGYLANPRIGALGYNLGHTLIAPALLLALAAAGGAWALFHVALIWAAHIGMDRVVGYGFKYATGFKDTHLGRI